jgi:hypothetical protein
MPQAVRVTLLEHHNPAYTGDHDLLVHLVQLSDFLLRHDTRPPRAGDFPVHSVRTLQLLPEQVLEVFSGVMATRRDLVSLSHQLAAAS